MSTPRYCSMSLRLSSGRSRRDALAFVHVGIGHVHPAVLAYDFSQRDDERRLVDDTQFAIDDFGQLLDGACAVFRPRLIEKLLGLLPL